MTKASKWFPDFLNERYQKMLDLEEACQLLEDLKNTGAGMETERKFLREEKDRLERELDETTEETMQQLECIRSNHRAYAAAMLRFIIGYKWEAAGKVLNMTGDGARSLVIRAFKSAAAENRQS